MQSKYICACVMGLLGLRIISALPANRAGDLLLPFDSAERFDRDFYYATPLSNYRLNNLRRGYYFVDDGYISAVPSYGSSGAIAAAAPASSRRQDEVEARGNRYSPVLKYKQTKTKKHKKLFVPNFFG